MRLSGRALPRSLNALSAFILAVGMLAGMSCGRDRSADTTPTAKDLQVFRDFVNKKRGLAVQTPGRGKHRDRDKSQLPFGKALKQDLPR